MLKSVFLFFLWLDTIYYGSAAAVVTQNSVILFPTRAECIVAPPAGWVPYTVRSTDALTELANRTGVTVEELVAVNCLVTSEVTKSLLLVAPKLLDPVTPTSAVTVQPSMPLSDLLTATAVTTVTMTTTPPTSPTAVPTTIPMMAISVTTALSGSMLLLPTPEPAPMTDARPTFWSINGIGGISALILLVLLVLRDSIRNLQGRWQRFYLLLNRLLLPLLLLFLLLVVIRLFGVL